MAWPGEEKGWDLLARQNPQDVEARSKSLYNGQSSKYELLCLGQDIHISLTDRTINGTSPFGNYMTSNLGDYAQLSILRYLTDSKDVPLTGLLLRPSDLPGGDMFMKGTHVLPLDRIAAVFGKRNESYLDRGLSLGGQRQDYGDISLVLFPFPRIPITLILWSGDDEFPSRCSLLFDSSCLSHLTTDLLWSTAMMTVEMMLRI